MRSINNYTLKGNGLKRVNGEICNNLKANAISVDVATNNGHSVVYFLLI